MMRMTILGVLILFANACAVCKDEGGKSTPHVRLYVIDSSTKATLENVTFTENGAAIAASCSTQDGGCSPWDLAIFYGKHTLSVAAPNYQSATITVDTGMDATCPKEPDHIDTETVELTH